MKIPVSWLKNYVEIQPDIRQLAHELTMAGLEVAELKFIGETWESDRLLVGEIIDIKPHPNADRLRLPTINLGKEEVITVVCGAPNIEIGQKIAFAKEGATLINPRTLKSERLKAGVIREVESKGMVCSALELGLSEEHEGILVLDKEVEVGTPLSDVLSDQIIETELTPNRPDCLSVIGTAYEIAAIQQTTVSEPISSDMSFNVETKQTLTVGISDESLCRRYMGAVIKGIKISESPRWLRDALTKSGQRSINNLVDITNYVMLEYGQPLHAFDLNKIQGNQIDVRLAKKGEFLETLDGEDRILRDSMLVIADENSAIGLAGIMGGANTEVDSNTTEIFLEAANFDAANIRQTRGTLGLSTEASYRFERRLRPELTFKGISRAIELVTQLCGGKLTEPVYDVYPEPKVISPIMVTKPRIKKILGAEFTMPEVWTLLERLGFEKVQENQALINLIETIEAKPFRGEESLLLLPPNWRSDIEIEDDIIEEFARVYGYDKLPMHNMASELPSVPSNPRRVIRENIRDNLVNFGLNETISYSVSNYDDLVLTGGDFDVDEIVRLQNPMDTTRGCLRNSIRANALETVSNNRKLDQHSGLAIFEIGNTFRFSSEKDSKLPNEEEEMVAVLTGPRSDFSIWSESVNNFDYFDAKAVVESALKFRSDDLNFVKRPTKVFHPGLSVAINIGSSVVGSVGLLNESIAKRYELDDSPVFLIELNLEEIYRQGLRTSQQYDSPSKFPSSTRDVALVAQFDTESSSIETIILKNKLVIETYPIDLYEDESSETKNKFITYRIVFQSRDHTLSTEEIDKAQQQILKSLKYQLSTVPRY